MAAKTVLMRDLGGRKLFQYHKEIYVLVDGTITNSKGSFRAVNLATGEAKFEAGGSATWLVTPI